MEATSLDTMRYSLLTAQGFVDEMKTAFIAVKEADRCEKCAARCPFVSQMRDTCGETAAGYSDFHSVLLV